MALNAVTKHLKMLERAGLIEREKQGREVLISFRGEPLRQVADGCMSTSGSGTNASISLSSIFKDKKRKEKKDDECDEDH